MKSDNHLYSPLIHCPITVSCNTITNQPSLQQLNPLIPLQTNYHTIPITLEQLDNLETIKIIQGILTLQLSKNKVLDVTLPIQIEKGQGQILSRCIFVNNRLVGVRTRIKQDKQRGILKKKDIFKSILTQFQCPVGQFYLHLQNTKIAFIFQSEIKKFPLILQQYASMGCEIFSIVSDVTFSMSKYKQIEQHIRKFGSQYSKLIIFSSLLLAPNSKQMYTGGSFISVGENLLQDSLASIYNQSETIISTTNLITIKKSKDYSKMNSYTNFSISEIHFPSYMYSTLTEKGRVFLQKPFFIQNKNIQLYHLWNLYVKVNKKTPFYISTNLNQSTKSLIYYISKLCEDIIKSQSNMQESSVNYCQLLQKLLVIYVYNNQKIQDKFIRKITKSLSSNLIYLSFDHNLIKTYQTLLQRNNLQSNFCFYTSNFEEIKSLQNIQSSQIKNITVYTNLEWLTYFVMEKPENCFSPQKISSSKINEPESYLDILNDEQKQPIIQKTNKVKQSPLKSNQVRNLTRLEKLNLIKQRKKQKKDICHICSNIFPQHENLTLRCNCGNSFCIDCLNNYKVETDYFDNDCIVCKRKCFCPLCMNKNQLKTFRNNCHKCGQTLRFILKAKAQSYITVQCCTINCKVVYCIKCICQHQKINPQSELPSKLFIDSFRDWRCYSCRFICDCLLCNFKRQQLQERDFTISRRIIQTDFQKQKQQPVIESKQQPLMIFSKQQTGVECKKQVKENIDYKQIENQNLYEVKQKFEFVDHLSDGKISKFINYQRTDFSRQRSREDRVEAKNSKQYKFSPNSQRQIGRHIHQKQVQKFNANQKGNLPNKSKYRHEQINLDKNQGSFIRDKYDSKNVSHQYPTMGSKEIEHYKKQRGGYHNRSYNNNFKPNSNNSWGRQNYTDHHNGNGYNGNGYNRQYQNNRNTTNKGNWNKKQVFYDDFKRKKQIQDEKIHWEDKEQREKSNQQDQAQKNPYTLLQIKKTKSQKFDY